MQWYIYIYIWDTFRQVQFHSGCRHWSRRSKHCAKNRKVMGLIPNEAVRNFPSLDTSGCTMSLHLTEMIIRNIYSLDKGGRCVGLTSLPPSCADCLGILGACPGLYFYNFTFNLQFHSTLCLPYRASDRQLCHCLYFLSYDKYCMNSSNLNVLCYSLHNSAQLVAVPY
jgi:hypothetical protein